jgi:hypothetical protein
MTARVDVTSRESSATPDASPQLRKIVETALPGARILQTTALGPDSQTDDETAKGTGYGRPVRVEVEHRGRRRVLVLHTATTNEFGHDRRADRAAAAVLAADTFGSVPRHVEVLDMGAYRGRDDSVSLAGTGEFYLLTAHAEGAVYADDLRHIAQAGTLSATDGTRALALVRYLAELHLEKAPGGKPAYARFWRDTLGSGEGIFGIADGYPDSVPGAPRARLERVEEACLRWRFRLRGRSERLRRTHGDFHPFNVLFDEHSSLAVLDASRGALGDPADDVTCMSINYAFFSLGHTGAWRGAFASLWSDFWADYVARTHDEAIFEVVAPLFAWRGLVVANPTWYPELAVADRERLLSFVERVLTVDRFVPAMAREYFET